VAIGVEAHAEGLEVAEARRGLGREHLGGAAADEPAAGDDGVLEMALRRVVDRQRGREASLRPVGGGLGKRPRGRAQ